MIKIFKLTKSDKEKITPFDRPFYKIEKEINLVDNPNDADFILLDSNPSIYFKQIKDFNKHKHKMVVWVNNDNPDFLSDEDGVNYKFIAQPSGKKLKHITVPLVMTDHDKWHLDSGFLEKCRNQEKIYDYCFMGQIYGKRNKLKTLDINNFLLKQTGSIYSMDSVSKAKSIESYLLELAKCKFAFTPRGTGSNSFRLYESLMVGTVPISTDVIEYPYEDEVKWDNFSIRGSMDNIEDLIKCSRNIDYESFREKGINFWENYVKMDVMYNKLVETINGSN